MKEIEDDVNRWKDIPCSWIRRINIVKMTTLTKAIYRFNAIPIEVPMAFFTEVEQNVFFLFWRHKRPRISKSTLRKEIGAGGIKLPGYITKLQSSKQYSTGQTNKKTEI